MIIRRLLKNSILFLLLILSAQSMQGQNLTKTSNFSAVLVPRYMSSGTSNRLPVVFRATLSGLTANTTYRYYVQAARYTDFGTTAAGAGIVLSINDTNFKTSSTGSLTTAGSYDSITTDASGNYTGWFGLLNSGNTRFTAGNYVYPSIVIDGGSANRGVTTYRWAMPDSILVLGLTTGSGATDGTGIYGRSNAPSKQIVALYDSINGSRPLSVTYTESDLITPASLVSFYTSNVEGVKGAWGTIIPNANSNGVRKIERRNLDGSIYITHVDADGNWRNAVNTVNPAGGATAIALSALEAPLERPRVSFLMNREEKYENEDSFMVWLRFENVASDSVRFSVSLASSGNTATSGVDFFFSTRNYVINPYSMDSIYFPVLIGNDAVAESDELLILELSNAGSGVDFGQSKDTLVILNDDSPSLSFMGSGTTVFENAGSASVKVLLANGNTNATNVTVAIKSKGVLTNIPAEFVISSNFSDTIIGFSGSKSFDTLSVANLIIDESTLDPSDTITLVLRNANNSAQITSDSTFTIIVLDNDKTPEISFATDQLTIAEPAGSVKVKVNVTFRNSSSSSAKVVVMGGTAIDGTDYTFAPDTQTVSFSPADPDSMILTIPIINDNLYELTEYFTLKLIGYNNAMAGTNDTVRVWIVSEDLRYLPIGQVSTEDANGVADSLGKRYELHGVVYGVNTKTSAGGWQMFIRDNTGGIQLFSPSKTYNYTVRQGDSVHVWGRIAQFNGLTQVDFIDTLILVDSNRTIQTPKTVVTLNETHESDYVRLIRVRNGSASTVWPNNGNTRVVTSNGDTVEVRTLSITGLPGKAIPSGYFNVVGMGSQFDNTSPYLQRYQIIPFKITDITPFPTISFGQDSITNLETDDSTSSIDINISTLPTEDVDFQVVLKGGTAINGFDFVFTTRNFTFQSGMATPMSFKVNLMDDTQLDGDKTIQLALRNISQSGDIGPDSVVTITILDNGIEGVEYVLGGNVLRMYPNPADEKLRVEMDKPFTNVSIYNMTGTKVFEAANNSNSLDVNVSELTAGIYMIIVNDGEKQFSRKLVIR